jgi:hypothetical protein
MTEMDVLLGLLASTIVLMAGLVAFRVWPVRRR